jgi:hypothetical protein
MINSDRCKQLADYILNHYDRNSDMDKICLGKRLIQLQLDAYKSGMTTAAELVVKEYPDDMDLPIVKQTIIAARDSLKELPI